MTQADRRYDRLAVRLSSIISRLLAGETLSVRKLAAEFGVSARTLRRDFRERLMYLDLEYRNGLCRLPEHHNPARHGQDVLMFVRQTGMENVFPGLDNRLVNTLSGLASSPARYADIAGAFLPSDSGNWRAATSHRSGRRPAL